jgi:hypothetical protein
MKDPSSALPTVDGGAHAAHWQTGGGETGRLVRSMCRPLVRLEFESWLTGGGSAATGGSEFRRVHA